MSRSISETFQALKADISNGDIEKAIKRAEGIYGPVGTVLIESLNHHDEGSDIVQEVMTIKGEYALTEANRGISTLAIPKVTASEHDIPHGTDSDTVRPLSGGSLPPSMASRKERAKAEQMK
jgi:hypothetical protein